MYVYGYILYMYTSMYVRICIMSNMPQCFCMIWVQGANAEGPNIYPEEALSTVGEHVWALSLMKHLDILLKNFCSIHGPQALLFWVFHWYIWLLEPGSWKYNPIMNVLLGRHWALFGCFQQFQAAWGWANPKSIFGRCKFPLNHVGIWTCIKPATWIKLMHVWYLFQRTSTFIFQPDPVVEQFHIPSCFRILSTGREKTGAVRWLLKDVDNRDYWPGCVAEDVPLNWARGCRLIMNAVKEVMGWHDFTCPRECTGRELDGGLQKNRKSW